MKITVWTLASDDANGTQAAVFVTEREALEAYADMVVDQLEKEDGEKAARLISKHVEESSWTDVANQTEGEENEDIYEFLSKQHGPLDTYSVESHELEVPLSMFTNITEEDLAAWKKAS